MNRTITPRRAQIKCVFSAEYNTRALFGLFLSCLAFYVSLIGISHLGETESENQAKVLFQLIWQAQAVKLGDRLLCSMTQNDAICPDM